MDDSRHAATAGQAVYTPWVLHVYDLFVLGISNWLIWRSPTPTLLAHYDRHVTGNHLDVGVGTGYYMDHCRFPTATPRLALMDLNPNALRHAAGRLARYAPETYRCNVLEPIGADMPRFDSIGLNYLLHCLPGRIQDKAIAFDNLAALGNPGATVFGATLLNGGVRRSPAARALMALYNRLGIFCNRGDDLAGLELALHSRFDSVRVEVRGCAALFSGRIPTAASACGR